MTAFLEYNASPAFLHQSNLKEEKITQSQSVTQLQLITLIQHICKKTMLSSRCIGKANNMQSEEGKNIIRSSSETATCSICRRCWCTLDQTAECIEMHEKKNF